MENKTEGKINNDISKQRQVIEFWAVAKEFCNLVETASKMDSHRFMETMLRLLSLMYLKGSLLPYITPKDENQNERFVNEEQWEKIYLSLKELLGKDDAFEREARLDEIDPGQENILVTGSLAEHITDIWQDIKDFILLYNKTNILAKENAVWACFLLFRANWGYKTAEIIKSLHQKVFMNEENNEEFDI